MRKTSGQFHFAKHDNIGANAAEEDAAFLADCFVDTGEMQILLDFDNPKCIVGGRTGCGKSALIQRIIDKHTNVIEIRPESLSFNYIANSTVIRFFADLGVNLDPFFKLLWRHIIAVEVIQRRFQIKTEEAKQTWLQGWFISQKEKAKQAQAAERHRRAMQYLEKFGKQFWQETEYRTREIATQFEEELRKSMSTKVGGNLSGNLTPITITADIGTNREAVKKLSREEKGEWITRGQSVINSVQVRELDEIFNLISELLEDYYGDYIIVIDRLDDSWVDESIRFRLIRTLIDTAREFRAVKKVKLIIGLRRDLVERVFKMTRADDAGFQEEKFRSLFLPVTWSKDQLVELVDKRIAKLVKDRYTKAAVTHHDILNAQKIKLPSKNVDPIDYILARTWMRPRDVIEFFNICIQQAVGKSSLTTAMVVAAESEYSRSRFGSLADEWGGLYPYVTEFLKIYRKMRSTFRLADISDATVDDFCLNFAIQNERADGPLATIAKAIVDGIDSHEHFRTTTASIFYRVGVCGLKTESYSQYQWCTEGIVSVSPAEISDQTHVTIHPALWRVLGIVP